jgi:putative ABC transport system permease protein
VLYTDGVLDEGERASLAADLDSEADLEDYTFCYLTSVTLESPTYSVSGNLLAVEQPEDLTGFLTFRDRHTGKPVELGQEGALISEKTADLLGLSVGDSITVVSGDDRGSVPVTGIVENYVQHYVYLTKAAYQQAFGKDPGDKQVLLRYPEDADWEEMGSRLLNLDEVSGVYYLKESKELIRKQLNGVYPAVIIIISAAAALAFVVLYNLSSINITERLRELATMRVLGFRDREMRDYVFRENLVLTLIGMALGVVMGKFFHQYLITTVEVELVMFGRSAHPASYGFAILLTILFALLVNLIAGRRLAKIDMVESLKTVE